jgi:tetraacyldisaccharide 4'-kinase
LRVKTPAFWARRGGLARVLAPLGFVARRLTARRVQRPGYAPGIPVICAGNAGVGGAGKTILVLDLLARLPGRPFALTRGYKGRLAGPVRVAATHTPRAVGDEALLLAAVAPTIVARDRAAGARLALAEAATAIVMDDGLQNPALAKTISFLVIDGGYGFGNSLLLPAGPLREPVAAAAARCQAAVLIGADTTNALAALPPGLPVLRAELAASCAHELAGQAVVAFAGIGRPEKFWASLSDLGADIKAKIAFADHHAYGEGDARRLLRLAAAHQARLVTTEKDFVKLPPGLQSRAAVLRVHLVWQDTAELEKILAGIV